MELRDYQKQAISNIYQYIRDNAKSILCVAPTGAGKTVLMGKLTLDSLTKNRRVLILCHRLKLVNQTITTLENFGISRDNIGLIAPGNPERHERPIQIAMIQTIARRQLPANIGLVIADEAHVTTYFKTYFRIQCHYAGVLLHLSKCLFIGFTATPYRMKDKKEAFCQFYQRIVYVATTRELIDKGFLTRERIFVIKNQLKLRELSLQDGEYKLSELIRVCGEEYNAEVVSSFENICPERKAIAFCVGIEQATNLVETFRSRGFTANYLVADTTSKVREQLFADFRSGAIQILVSVGCLTEGFDEPSCSAVILARPTKSKPLALQMIGRGLRLHTNKEDCLILDLGDITKLLHKSGADFLDDRAVNLCHTKPDPLPTKDCDGCGKKIPKFARKCPFCGHEFVDEGSFKMTKKVRKVKPLIPLEYLNDAQKAQLKYLLKSLITSYLERGRPWEAELAYKAKYGELPIQAWVLGCIYGQDGLKDVYNYGREYVNWCLMNNPYTPFNRIDLSLKLEFGYPHKKYLLSDGSSYTAPDLNIDIEAIRKEIIDSLAKKPLELASK